MPLQDFKEEQPQVVSLLLAGLRRSRVSHAYLFYGPDGVGKKALALELARAVNCSQSLDACGHCLSCQKIDQSNHPDVEIVTPQEGSLKISQIRHLQQRIYYQPYEGKKKVYVVQDSHCMTIAAQNCLLKTLEAPPHYAILILVTNNKDALLSTILSRCQRILFTRLKGVVFSQKIQTQHHLSVEAASIFQSLGDGQLSRAQELADDEEIWVLRKEILQVFPALMEGGYTEGFQIVKEIEARYSKKMDAVFSILLSLFRDLLLLKSGAQEEIINTDYQEALCQMVPEYTFMQLQQMVEIVQKTDYQIRRYAIKRLALEVMWLKIRGRGDLEDEKGGLDYL